MNLQSKYDVKQTAEHQNNDTDSPGEHKLDRNFRPPSDYISLYYS